MTKPRICVVGAGRWGRNHIRTLHNLGFLAGVVEADEALRKQITEEYEGIPVHSDLKSVSFENFDGFTVATPAETHFAIATEILNQGKHVLVEKPITLNWSSTVHSHLGTMKLT